MENNEVKNLVILSLKKWESLAKSSHFTRRNLELLRAKVVLKKSRSASIDGIFGLSTASLATLREDKDKSSRLLATPEDGPEAGATKQTLSSIVSALG